MLVGVIIVGSARSSEACGSCSSIHWSSNLFLSSTTDLSVNIVILVILVIIMVITSLSDCVHMPSVLVGLSVSVVIITGLSPTVATGLSV